ncbi:MAG: DUF1573 domain-containing protein [Anaerolineae bacterium]|nr:DUF1573 domain-containing protein [Anaerolineae bacterium]
MGRSRKSRHSRPSSSPSKSILNEKNLLRLAVILIVLGILLGGAALLFQPGQSSYVPEVLGGPRIALAEDVIDFGDVPVNKPVEAVFRVRNIGDQVLRILDYEPPVELVEGC